MSAVAWLITIGLLALSPECRFTHDRRSFDGERYVELCAGLYQKPVTWACMDVSR